MSSEREQAGQNTDVEIWRGKSRAKFGDDDRFYADSLFIPKSEVEALGINCGGTVIVKPIHEWHKLASAHQRGFDEAKQSLDKLRIDGWMVAIHNDYRQDGKFRTFWLFVKDSSAIKGEGYTDDEAIAAAIRALERKP